MISNNSGWLQQATDHITIKRSLRDPCLDITIPDRPTVELIKRGNPRNPRRGVHPPPRSIGPWTIRRI